MQGEGISQMKKYSIYFIAFSQPYLAILDSFSQFFFLIIITLFKIIEFILNIPLSKNIRLK